MTNEHIKKVDERMVEVSKSLPVEVLRAFEKVIKSNFEERGVAYTEETLWACVVALNITIPQLPQMFSELMMTAVLCLYQLIEEKKTGNVASDVLILPKQNEQHPPKTEEGTSK